MYDCLELDPVVLPQLRIDLHRRWRNRNRLMLRCASTIAPHYLQLAAADANRLGLLSQNLPDGSLLIFDLSLEQALTFQRQFSDLLVHFEPAAAQYK
jgi:hypothetical protein